ncbi:MAG: PilW family protein [Candidatus Manganitrophaceae bacterium]
MNELRMNRDRGQGGFTLLELLIATVVTVIVGAAGYSFFGNTFNFSVIHSRNVEMQRETRIAVDVMSREIRNAGLGIVNPLALAGAPHPAAAGFGIITAGNNVDPDPAGVANRIDRITLWGGYQLIGMLTCAAPPCSDPVVGAGALQILVKPLAGTTPINPTVNAATITLDGFYTGLVTAVVGPDANGAFLLTLNTPLNRAYSQNNSVLWMQRIDYDVNVPAVGQEPILRRSVSNYNPLIMGASAQIASGIEDLQFLYLLNGGAQTWAPAAAAPVTATPIRAVRFSLLARGRDPDPKVTSVSARPVLEDHAAGVTDNFHRRLMSKVTEVRNLGF